MNYALIENGQIVAYPVHPRRAFPNVSFPEVINASCLPEGCVEVLVGTHPEPTRYERVIKQDPALVDGVWVQGWSVEALSEAEIASVNEQGMIELRATRDQVIRESVDTMNPMRWNALTGVQQDAWEAYRQALLDLPQVTNDPFNPVWPTPPALGSTAQS